MGSLFVQISSAMLKTKNCCKLRNETSPGCSAEETLSPTSKPGKKHVQNFLVIVTSSYAPFKTTSGANTGSKKKTFRTFQHLMFDQILQIYVLIKSYN